jgi:hypothetical protein
MIPGKYQYSLLSLIVKVSAGLLTWINMKQKITHFLKGAYSPFSNRHRSFFSGGSAVRGIKPIGGIHWQNVG